MKHQQGPQLAVYVLLAMALCATGLARAVEAPKPAVPYGKEDLRQQAHAAAMQYAAGKCQREGARLIASQMRLNEMLTKRQGIVQQGRSAQGVLPRVNAQIADKADSYSYWYGKGSRYTMLGLVQRSHRNPRRRNSARFYTPGAASFLDRRDRELRELERTRDGLKRQISDLKKQLEELDEDLQEAQAAHQEVQKEYMTKFAGFYREKIPEISDDLLAQAVKTARDRAAKRAEAMEELRLTGRWVWVEGAREVAQLTLGKDGKGTLVREGGDGEPQKLPVKWTRKAGALRLFYSDDPKGMPVVAWQFKPGPADVLLGICVNGPMEQVNHRALLRQREPTGHEAPEADSPKQEADVLQ